jgi:hypothetical protein
MSHSFWFTRSQRWLSAAISLIAMPTPAWSKVAESIASLRWSASSASLRWMNWPACRPIDPRIWNIVSSGRRVSRPKNSMTPIASSATRMGKRHRALEPGTAHAVPALEEGPFGIEVRDPARPALVPRGAHQSRRAAERHDGPRLVGGGVEAGSSLAPELRAPQLVAAPRAFPARAVAPFHRLAHDADHPRHRL